MNAVASERMGCRMQRCEENAKYYGEMTVTPEMAEKWLRKNAINRPMRQDLALNYAAMMERGEWLPNGFAF